MHIGINGLVEIGRWAQDQEVWAGGYVFVEVAKFLSLCCLCITSSNMYLVDENCV